VWKKDVEFETNKKIQAARTDNAPELLKAIVEWREEGAGTGSEQTTAASSHQNGSAERNIHTAEADACNVKGSRPTVRILGRSS
jgi:hypothetical protein